jgi:hypothetical protein
VNNDDENRRMKALLSIFMAVLARLLLVFLLHVFVDRKAYPPSVFKALFCYENET